MPYVRCILKGEPIHISIATRPSPELDKANTFSVSYHPFLAEMYQLGSMQSSNSSQTCCLYSGLIFAKIKCITALLFLYKHMSVVTGGSAEHLQALTF